MKVYSFVRSGNSDITSFTADVKLFFNYLVSNQQFPASSQNLIGEFPSTEHPEIDYVDQ